jgi:predicted flap endonuclease-1-like 5' DNA nuclease
MPKKEVMRMVKKKEVEPRDSHAREGYLAEGKERYSQPAPSPPSTTGIPMPPIAPIPVATPIRIEQSSVPKHELLRIEGIDEGIVAKLARYGIGNIDELVAISPEEIAKKLQVGLSAARKWVSAAKKLQ